MAAAEQAGGAEHGFRVLQLPLNPLERRGASVASRAGERGLGVLANRPLNALVEGGGLRRLADPGEVSSAGAFRHARRQLVALERQAEAVSARDLPRWSVDLPQAMRRLGSAVDFDDFLARFAAPRTAQATRVASDRAWLARYQQAWGALMASARAQLAVRDRQRLEPVVATIDGELPEELRTGSVARRACAWVATRPGVTAALVGMRRPAWVEDVTPLRSASLPPTQPAA